MGLWHRTVDGKSGKWVPADRGALPSQSVFLTGEEKGVYITAEPKDDARFVAVFSHSLEHTGGYTPEEATRVARTLLPDILSYDPTRPAAYPGEWPETLRRRYGWLHFHPHKWKGDPR